MAVYEWRSLSWPAFRSLPRQRLLAVLPLGALEAHGPHLPLGTDVAIADAMARAGSARLARRGFEVVLFPPLPFAPAPFAAAFEGTVDVEPSVTTLLIKGIAESAARHGARATVVANAHHDPAHVHAIRDAVRQVTDAGTGFVVFPDLTRRQWAARLTEEFQSGACHAGRYESSIALATDPAHVDVKTMTTLPENPRSLVDAIRQGLQTFAGAGGPEAYFGAPADATAAEGREIIERLGAILEEAVLAVIPPDPDAQPEPDADPVSALGVVNPPALGRPLGFSHGITVPAGWGSVHVAGQTAGSGEAVRAMDFSTQFERALARVVEVVRAAGADTVHITRMTIYVTDLEAYHASRPRLAAVWTRAMKRHYPAIALLQVVGLVDEGATVEIEADAALPPSPYSR